LLLLLLLLLFAGVQELRPAYPFVYTICHLVYHLLRLAASASHQAAALLISDKNYQYILRQQVRVPPRIFFYYSLIGTCHNMCGVCVCVYV
jgi:hypothetical protein